MNKLSVQSRAQVIPIMFGQWKRLLVYSDEIIPVPIYCMCSS